MIRGKILAVEISVPISVTCNLVVCIKMPQIDQAGNARTNMWWFTNKYANEPLLNISDFCCHKEIIFEHSVLVGKQSSWLLWWYPSAIFQDCNWHYNTFHSNSAFWKLWDRKSLIHYPGVETFLKNFTVSSQASHDWYQELAQNLSWDQSWSSWLGVYYLLAQKGDNLLTRT